MRIPCITPTSPCPMKGWGKSDKIFFSVSCYGQYSLVALRLFAEVRNRSEYPYRNLYLFIHENLLDSTVWRTDTIAVNLADSTGRWTGNGWGSIYQTAVFVKSVRPLHPGNYTVKIVPQMPDEKLTGLNDVGIRIEKQGE